MSAVLSPFMVEIYTPMKASRLLAENITALLELRHATQHDLAFYCRHQDVWLSYILSGKRGMPIDELDRVAEFLGVEVYQLFQPGVSRNSERRISERRVQKERRQPNTLRTAQALGYTIAASTNLYNDARQVPESSAEIRILANAMRQIERLRSERKSGEQTKVDRKRRPRKSA